LVDEVGQGGFESGSRDDAGGPDLVGGVCDAKVAVVTEERVEDVA